MLNLSTHHIKKFIKKLVPFEESTTTFFAKIIKAYLQARKLRISDIANSMRDIYHRVTSRVDKEDETIYKAIQRFLDKFDVETFKDILKEFLSSNAEFIIIDPTEIPRNGAKNTEYVGILSDGKTRGFDLLVASMPYKGRAIPCYFTTYSSKTIDREASSRNLKHLSVLEEIKEIVGNKPLVFDREFSYEGFLKELERLRIKFVIRLNTGNKVRIKDERGNEIVLKIARGEMKIWKGVYYRGEIKIDLIGYWGLDFNEPLYVMTNIEPKEALKIYYQRMKIEESFRDKKSLLGIEKVMNKKEERMEKMIAIGLIAYGIGLIIGEKLRDIGISERNRRKYSGLHVLLNKTCKMKKEIIELAVLKAYEVFEALIGDS